MQLLQTGSKGGTEVRAIASHQCGPTTGVDAICGLSLLVFLFAPGGLSPGIQVLASSQRPTVTNSISTRNGRQRAA